LSSRRDFLRAAGVVGARLCLGSAAGGCACDLGTAARVPGCGAATFEVTPTSALVSVHAGERTQALIRVAGEDGEIELSTQLRADADHTGVVELDGLEPDREYEYAVTMDGGELGPYRVRTAPLPDSDAPFRFLFTGDIATDEGCSIFDTMAGSGADFWLSLGDFPYADAETHAQYRAEHRRARLASGAQTLLGALPAYAIYDDHEVKNNWDGMTRERDPDRVAAALAAWDEWFPMRTAGEQRYRSWRWGRLAEFFMLDCRRFRAANTAPDVEGKSMLGAAQREWLLAGLKSSSAVFKFVITSVPLAFGTTGDDSWDGFRWERDQLLAAVIETPVPDTVFLAADQHWFASHHLAGGIVEFQAGPAAAPLRRPNRARPEEVFRHIGRNFAEVTVHGGSEPQLLVRAVGPRGQELYRETVMATRRA
jgi:phosphodiesterase/alkaline phosphatase D-like protein